jgi:RNA polymerase-interacting CarD/CdnL/TRCF family regulator
MKPLHGEQVPYFRVKIKDGTFWFPKDQPDYSRIRIVVTPEIIQRAQREFQKNIRDLDPDRKMWKSRIDEVKASGELVATSMMVRDLTIMRTQRMLNQTEEKALNHFTDCLINEWSATIKTNIETIRQILNSFLQACRERASISQNND